MIILSDLMTNQVMDRNTLARIGVLFAICYVILFLAGRVFYAWDSPMYFLPPIVAFFITYFLIDWIDKFYETGAAHKWHFLLLILVIALVAEYIALFWYYGSLAQLNQSKFEITFGLSDPAVLNSSDSLSIGFVQQLKTSAFLPFALACILGWLSHIIIDGTQPKKEKAHRHKSGK